MSLEVKEKKELEERINDLKLPTVRPEYEDDHLESTYRGQIVKERRAFLEEYKLFKEE